MAWHRGMEVQVTAWVNGGAGIFFGFSDQEKELKLEKFAKKQ